MASTVCNPLSAISRRRRWMAGAGQMKLMTCRNLLIESVHDVSQRGRRITMDSTLRPALCTTPQGNLPSPTPARRCNTPAFSRHTENLLSVAAISPGRRGRYPQLIRTRLQLRRRSGCWSQSMWNEAGRSRGCCHRDIRRMHDTHVLAAPLCVVPLSEES
ncbi:hypothetical protein BU26DRAFT_311325 [Trematosphaeria pertusa]|uniref:Uncharacterized protein n=1 Tax=Trematosphaeria pertusa TaxID=390896 RepID=A0A6A6IG97_9PLEO|nr:uncharacterized protein BU26DRAFT_311325 [Trematosphaeria pertusa]KAF2249058.1 hypothetical protein BU26DRAFT_311325 [Trematosphaeria pertusa]